MKAILILFLISVTQNTLADTLKPFTTDGCSLFPNGNLSNNSKWFDCCIKHDISYWMGGTQNEREKADDNLQQCVESLGEKELSTIMRLGVKVGGAPVFPTWYRWGYGWPYSRGYKKLSEDERNQVNTRLLELRALIDETLKYQQHDEVTQ